MISIYCLVIPSYWLLISLEEILTVFNAGLIIIRRKITIIAFALPPIVAETIVYVAITGFCATTIYIRETFIVLLRITLFTNTFMVGCTPRIW